MGRKDLSAGTRGSFGERAARSLAAPTTTEDRADHETAVDTATGAAADTAPPEPASRAVARVDGPPPPEEGGPWVWVDLPDEAGTVRVRAAVGTQQFRRVGLAGCGARVEGDDRLEPRRVGAGAGRREGLRRGRFKELILLTPRLSP